MVVAVEGWSEASRYLDKLLLLYDSIRHVGPILFFLKSIVSRIRQQVVRISLILRLTWKKFQKFFSLLSAFIRT